MVFSATWQPGWTGRLIPWETVEALRRDWTAALDAIGVAPQDRDGFMGAYTMELRESGQPTQTDLARRYGLAVPKVNLIVRGKIYQYPPGIAEEVSRARRSASATARYAQRRGDAS